MVLAVLVVLWVDLDLQTLMLLWVGWVVAAAGWLLTHGSVAASGGNVQQFLLPGTSWSSLALQPAQRSELGLVAREYAGQTGLTVSSWILSTVGVGSWIRLSSCPAPVAAS